MTTDDRTGPELVAWLEAEARAITHELYMAEAISWQQFWHGAPYGPHPSEVTPPRQVAGLAELIGTGTLPTDRSWWRSTNTGAPPLTTEAPLGAWASTYT